MLKHRKVLALLALAIALLVVTIPAYGNMQRSEGQTAAPFTQDQANAIAKEVARNPTFVAAENGSSYSLVDYATFGTTYRNGTQVTGVLLLYFEHFAPVNGKTVPVSELQVYSNSEGTVLSIQAITDPVELNMYMG